MDMDTIDELRGRIDELELIRQGFACHLGASLYDTTKDMPEMREGRETLYDGIARCDAELERTRALISEIEAREEAAETLVMEQTEAPSATCPVCGGPVEATHKYCMNCGARLII